MADRAGATPETGTVVADGARLPARRRRGAGLREYHFGPECCYSWSLTSLVRRHQAFKRRTTSHLASLAAGGSGRNPWSRGTLEVTSGDGLAERRARHPSWRASAVVVVAPRRTAPGGAFPSGVVAAKQPPERPAATDEPVEVTSAPKRVSTSASALRRSGWSVRRASRSGSSPSTRRSGSLRRQTSIW